MTIPWHHSPVHLFVPDGIYFVTGGTLKKKHFYDSPARLELLQESLLGVLEKHEWIVHAWAVFVNHYHFIAKARGNTSLDALIEEFHFSDNS